MIGHEWLDLLRRRAPSYPVFRARDIEPEATNARRLIAGWRARGDVATIAYGYHLVVGDGPDVLDNIDVAANLVAGVRYGPWGSALCTLSAARAHGVVGLDPKVATVMTPLPTRPVRLFRPAGVLRFCTRAETVVGTRNVAEDEPWDVSGSRAIAITAVPIGERLVPATTAAQTALDLVHDPSALRDEDELDAALRHLAPLGDPQSLAHIAFDQRRRRALKVHRNKVTLMNTWQL